MHQLSLAKATCVVHTDAQTVDKLWESVASLSQLLYGRSREILGRKQTVLHIPWSLRADVGRRSASPSTGAGWGPWGRGAVACPAVTPCAVVAPGAARDAAPARRTQVACSVRHFLPRLPQPPQPPQPPPACTRTWACAGSSDRRSPHLHPDGVRRRSNDSDLKRKQQATINVNSTNAVCPIPCLHFSARAPQNGQHDAAAQSTIDIGMSRGAPKSIKYACAFSSASSSFIQAHRSQSSYSFHSRHGELYDGGDCIRPTLGVDFRSMHKTN